MKTTWYHKSSYDDWNYVDEKLPEINKRVKVAHLRFMDWDLEYLEWESTGRYNGKNWSISASESATKDKIFNHSINIWKEL